MGGFIIKIAYDMLNTINSTDDNLNPSLTKFGRDQLELDPICGKLLMKHFLQLKKEPEYANFLY